MLNGKEKICGAKGIDGDSGSVLLGSGECWPGNTHFAYQLQHDGRDSSTIKKFPLKMSGAIDYVRDLFRCTECPIDLVQNASSNASLCAES